MRRLLALGALLLLAVPAHAAAGDFVTTVGASDPDVNRQLHTARATVGYLDGNRNARADAQPDETLYLDLDDSGAVSYGDLRLSPFDTYAAGTVVDLPNRDVGRPLATAANAWFAQAGGPGGAWMVDVDASATVTAGDVAFAAAPSRVAAGDARIGQALSRPADAPTRAYGWTSADGRGAEAPFYIDLDPPTSAGSRTSPGDLRVSPTGFAPDNAPTRAEFEQALQRGTPTQAASTTSTTAAEMGSAPTAWRTLDWLVVGLAVLNLAGLVAVARQVNQMRGPPRNPFK